jgi:hypothetical protein
MDQMPVINGHSGRKKIRPVDKRLAIFGGVISLLFTVSLLLWLIGFWPIFSPTWLVIGCILILGMAGTIRYSRGDRWRGAGLIFSLFLYTIFTHSATMGSRSAIGFVILTFMFVIIWIATLVSPGFVVEVWDFITHSNLLWVRLYKKVAWIILLFMLAFIMIYFYAGNDYINSGILFYGWAVLSAFFTSVLNRPHGG